MVLRTYKLGEADRIVVFMTAERGKVRAVAKGVRKTKSRFGGRLESPNRVRLLMYEGRELDVITQVETADHFRALRDDLTRMTEAMALVEAVDQLAQEGEPNLAVYRMLVAALGTLARRPAPLLVAGFYWKLLGLEGVAPLVNACVRCGAGSAGDPVELVALDLVEGGALCRSCRPGSPDWSGPAGPGGHQPGPAAPAVTAAALAVIDQILSGDLRRALRTPEGPVAAEVASLATGALEAHLERRLRVVRTLTGPVGRVGQ